MDKMPTIHGRRLIGCLATLPRAALLLVTLASALCALGFPAHAEEPVLFYLEKQSKGGCEAKIHDFGTKRDITLFKADACPAFVLRDDPHERLLVAASDQLWSYTVAHVDPAGPLKREHMGALPAGEIADLWVDKGTDKLRVALMVPVPEEDVVTRGNPAKGGSVVYRFAGKEIDAKAVDAFDGLPYVAILLEWDGGKWTQLKTAATKTGAGEAPGIGVLGRRERSPAVWSLEAVLDAMTCAGTTKGVSPNCEDDGSQAKAVLGTQDAYGSLDLGNGRTATFPVVMGDTPHATGPVVLCMPDCKPSGKLKGTESRDPRSPTQYGLGSAGGFLLIVGENRDLPVRVFDEHGNKVLELPRATVAAWWPE